MDRRNKKFDVLVTAVEVDLTDAQLKAALLGMGLFLTENQVGGFIAISGYDDDPRPIWKIPECVSLCRRLYDLGFMTVLDVGLELGPDKQDLGITAIHLWCIVHGRMDNEVELSAADLMAFTRDLVASNERFRKNLCTT